MEEERLERGEVWRKLPKAVMVDVSSDGRVDGEGEEDFGDVGDLLWRLI